MVTRSQLIPILANVTGDSEKSVALAARVLREADFLSEGGRGRGGAQMTTRDAVNLLVGTVGGNPTAAVRSVLDFRSLRRKPGATASDNAPSVLRKVKDAETFGAALDRLISGGRELAEWMVVSLAEGYETEDRDRLSFLMDFGGLDLAVTFSHRPHGASIRFTASKMQWAENGGDLLNCEYSVDVNRLRAGEYWQEHGDRRDTSEVGQRTIIALARAVA